MKLLRHSTTVIFGLLLGTSIASADPVTVIVDLNDSPQEISAIQNAVGSENVIIIPERKGDQVAILNRLAEKKLEIRKLEWAEKVLGPAERAARLKIDEPNKKILNDDANGIRKELKASYGGNLPTEEQITEQITTVMKSHKVDRFVVSGEHFQEHTTGEMGILRDNSFLNMITAHSPQFDSVKSLYFLRCDTGGTNQNLLWKSVMHGLVQAVYYSAQAPSGANGAGIEVLRSTVSKEQKLFEAYEKDADHKAFFAAARDAVKVTGTSAVICVCEACYNNRPDKSLGCTPEGYNHVNEVMDTFDTMITSPDDPDNDFYCNTSASPARARYDDMEEYQSCDRTAKTPALRDAFGSRMGDLYRPGALAFFQNVATNFTQYNQADMEALNKIAKKHPGFSMIDLSQPLSCAGAASPRAKIGRRDLIKWITSLGDSAQGLSDAEKQCVTKMKTRMNMQLARLECIPERWVHDPSFAIPTVAPDSADCKTVMEPACD